MLRLFSGPTHKESESLKNNNCIVVIVGHAAAYYATTLEATFSLAFIKTVCASHKAKKALEVFD